MKLESPSNRLRKGLIIRCKTTDRGLEFSNRWGDSKETVDHWRYATIKLQQTLQEYGIKSRSFIGVYDIQRLRVANSNPSNSTDWIGPGNKEFDLWEIEDFAYSHLDIPQLRLESTTDEPNRRDLP